MTSASPPAMLRGLFEGYETGNFFDEMFLPSGEPRLHYAKLYQMLALLRPGQFEDRRNLADIAFLLQGITLPFYSDAPVPSRCSPSISFREFCRIRIGPSLS